jgi:O-antigen ligase
VAFLGLLAVGVLVAYSAAPLASQRRILALLQGNTGSSVDGRLRLYDEALESINQRPFGLGWGGFEGIAFAAYRWPHNLPLEVLAEAGVVFGGLFLVWMYLQAIRARRITVEYVGAAVFAVMLFWIGASMVSSDFNNNRVGLYALGVAIAAGSLIRPPGPREAVPAGPPPAAAELATTSSGTSPSSGARGA